MKYGQIRKMDIANGPGIRTSVFVTGCTHTKKKSIAIDTPVANNKAETAYKGIYTLEGMRLGNDFDRLPAGIYIVNGEKVMKQ